MQNILANPIFLIIGKSIEDFINLGEGSNPDLKIDIRYANETLEDELYGSIDGEYLENLIEA